MSGDPFLAALFEFFITGFRAQRDSEMKPSNFDKLGIGDSKEHRIKQFFGDTVDGRNPAPMDSAEHLVHTADSTYGFLHLKKMISKNVGHLAPTKQQIS